MSHTNQRGFDSSKGDNRTPRCHFEPYLCWSERLTHRMLETGVVLFEAQLRQPLGIDFLIASEREQQRRIRRSLARMLPCGEAKRWQRDRLIAVVSPTEYWSFDAYGERRLGRYIEG